MIVMGVLFTKLFELQKLNSRKTELALALSDCRALEIRKQLLGEVGHHKANEHQLSYDSGSYLDEITRLQGSTAAAKAEFDQVCEQIKEIEQQLETQFADLDW